MGSTRNASTDSTTNNSVAFLKTVGNPMYIREGGESEKMWAGEAGMGYNRNPILDRVSYFPALKYSRKEVVAQGHCLGPWVRGDERLVPFLAFSILLFGSETRPV